MLTRRALLRGAAAALLWPRLLWAQPLPPSDLRVNQMAHVQSKSFDASGNATTIAVTFDSNVTAGNLIAVGVGHWSGNTVTVADSLGNTYTQIRQVTDDANARRLTMFYAMNIAGGANTVTATFSASGPGRVIGVH